MDGSREGNFISTHIFQSDSRRGYRSGEGLYVDGGRMGYMSQNGDMYIDGCRKGEICVDGDVYTDGSRWGEVQTRLNSLEDNMYVFAFLYVFTESLR